ncbi:HipA domain-containing protein [Campylobacter sp. JMF_08 NE1]|uniref:HipA domain-containing protein n=1 Tax=Campylobacter sp. JMF_08 NE1 TaxID=2983821 RepID=UPI0022E9D15D|nr:HipA domain-containing protein [Campylobacter sp. JMF_08 NE1]MDA3048218.1 HipA domain-containing protein [Campylobacter sp. JMF_08 NE1]
MCNEIDFTTCKRNVRVFNGGNGSKIGIIYNNENYLLKFPPQGKDTTELSYTNSCFSEDISCKIFKTLGLNSQDTMLGKYKDKIVVACKDFTEIDYKLYDFASLKNTIIDSVNNGYGTELKDILTTIENQEIFQIDKQELKDFFWNMFIADSLLGNFDRHNGNWGFLINEKTGEHKIAPIYDCGSCLFPQADEKMMSEILTNPKALEMRIYTFPNSAIKENNVKIRPYHFLTNTNNMDCLKALQRITPKIDLAKINSIIDNTPYISNLHKDCLKIIIKERKEKILDYALNLAYEKGKLTKEQLKEKAENNQVSVASVLSEAQMVAKKLKIGKKNSSKSKEIDF